ncbi:hypothetical protein ACMSDQ_19495 [Bacteroides thetaiotaomicron]|uniref:hypothetical protein n=1 Tax=Bacteroides thetaiotaomicron TaxID=818 RepID=UPI0039C475AB
MKVNFYEEIEAGFELIRSHLINFSSTYHNSFKAITLEKPDNYEPTSSEGTRYDRLKGNHSIFRLDTHRNLTYLCAVTFKNNDYGKRKSKLSGGI